MPDIDREPTRAAPPDTTAARTEFDVFELLFRLLDQWKRIVAAALLGALLAAAWAFFGVRPTYEATAKLYVLNANDSAVNLSDLQIGAYLASDYLEVFKTWEVHEMVVANLGLTYPYETLGKMLTVSNPGGTRILYITVRSGDPREAAAIANEYAAVARKYIADTMATEQPTHFSVALAAPAPVNANKTMRILQGLILGAFLAIAYIAVRFMLDDKLRTADDILRYTDMPTLALVPAAQTAPPKARAPKRRKP